MALNLPKSDITTIDQRLQMFEYEQTNWTRIGLKHDGYEIILEFMKKIRDDVCVRTS